MTQTRTVQQTNYFIGILQLSWRLRVHYRVRMNSPRVTIRNRVNPLYTLTSDIEINSNIILTYTPKSSKWPPRLLQIASFSAVYSTVSASLELHMNYIAYSRMWDLCYNVGLHAVICRVAGFWIRVSVGSWTVLIYSTINCI